MGSVASALICALVLQVQSRVIERSGPGPLVGAYSPGVKGSGGAPGGRAESKPGADDIYDFTTEDLGY